MKHQYTEVREMIYEDPAKRRASLTADIGPFVLIGRKTWQEGPEDPPDIFMECKLVDPRGKERPITVEPDFLEELMDHMTFTIGWPEFLAKYRAQYDTPPYIVDLGTQDRELPAFQEFLKSQDIEITHIMDRGGSTEYVRYQGSEEALKEMIRQWWDDPVLFKWIEPMDMEGSPPSFP